MDTERGKDRSLLEAGRRLEGLLSGEDVGSAVTPLTQRLVRMLREAPEKVVFLSGQQLARELGTHPSTVIRFAQRLGFSGYPELIRTLQGLVLNRLSPSARFHRTLRSSSGEANISAFLETERSVLAEMDERLDAETMGRVIDRLMAAGKIFVFAEGPAVCLAELLSFRLQRFRFTVVYLAQTGKALFDRLISLGENDLLFAFGMGRPPEELGICLDHAHRVGARTIVVCDHLLPYHDRLVDMRVTLANRSLAEHRTMTAGVAFVELLTIELIVRHPERTLGALQDLQKLRSRHGYPRLALTELSHLPPPGISPDR